MFHKGESPPGTPHAVGTSYTALCTLREDAARQFGLAHVRAAYVSNFDFFYTLNNLGLEKISKHKKNQNFELKYLIKQKMFVIL